MTMMTRQIVGYDPSTERVAFEFYIPPDRWDAVLSLVRNNEGDPQYIYNYAIDVSLAKDIIGIAGKAEMLISQNLNYFLECETAA